MPGNRVRSAADQLVGGNIRRRRLQRGLGEPVAIDRLHCTTNDYQDVEAGLIRLEVDALHDLALLLDCRISDFFAAAPENSGLPKTSGRERKTG